MKSLKFRLEIVVQLGVEPVGVGGAELGEGLLDVIANEETAVVVPKNSDKVQRTSR